MVALPPVLLLAAYFLDSCCFNHGLQSLHPLRLHSELFKCPEAEVFTEVQKPIVRSVNEPVLNTKITIIMKKNSSLGCSIDTAPNKLLKF